MTLGALSVTGNSMKRAGAGVPLVHATPMPFDDYFDGAIADFHWFERVLDDSGSGFNRPAAVIVETVQGEGGVNVARAEWLRAPRRPVRQRRDILLIVDDVQMGCGRTGPFFSFEVAGITPDIVTLSKSIGGYGLPMALMLFKPELDVWAPGEHNGTFRGNNPAFVTAQRRARALLVRRRPRAGHAAQGRRDRAALRRAVASSSPASCPPAAAAWCRASCSTDPSRPARCAGRRSTRACSPRPPARATRWSSCCRR